MIRHLSFIPIVHHVKLHYNEMHLNYKGVERFVFPSMPYKMTLISIRELMSKA
jgi:hypothetical protein